MREAAAKREIERLSEELKAVRRLMVTQAQEQHGEAYSDKLRGILSQLAVETSSAVKYSRDGIKVGTTLYAFPQAGRNPLSNR